MKKKKNIPENLNDSLEDKLIEISIKNKQLQAEINSLKSDHIFLLNKLVHNLKNPVGASFSFSEMLIENMDGFESSKVEKYLGIIKNSSNHAIEILNSIAKLNSVKSNNYELDYSIENFTNFITSLIDSCNLKYKEKNICFLVNVPDNILLSFDKPELKFVVEELINNAVRFSQPNSSISIDIEKTDTYTTLIIKDNGIGFDPINSTNIYKDFFVENTYDIYQNKCLGLGLPTAKKIIDLHNGIIEISSKLTIGTTVKLKLPN